jgi:citronellol/citronellal dehydrogenase
MLILWLLLKQLKRTRNCPERFTLLQKKVISPSKKKTNIVLVFYSVEKAGGQCLPCVVDVRDEEQVTKAFEQAAKKFGGIDILINNASAISLTDTSATPMKRYDLMHSINARGTFLWYVIDFIEQQEFFCLLNFSSKVAIPYLKKSSNPHILMNSPPISLNPFWFKRHVAYTVAKYNMSLFALGLSAELREFGIAVNTLWPKTGTISHSLLFKLIFSYN